MDRTLSGNGCRHPLRGRDVCVRDGHRPVSSPSLGDVRTTSLDALRPIAVWTALVGVAVVVGERLRAAGELKLGGQPPFHGWPRPDAQTWQLAPALLCAIAVVAVSPRLT